jgi:hypothetical protein
MRIIQRPHCGIQQSLGLAVAYSGRLEDARSGVI